MCPLPRLHESLCVSPCRPSSVCAGRLTRLAGLRALKSALCRHRADLRSLVNLADAMIVVVSTAMQALLLSQADKCGDDWSAFLPILRVVRLLRLFIILDRVQHARPAGSDA